jgi:hypothetical protein
MEREEQEDRPRNRIVPEDAKPSDDMPSDRDLKPSADTDRVVEEKGREPEKG